ncbi:hypothetical protein [Aeromonas enteropelogenes]|uniref:hypothetical protein n=1 Tax=Aeromonas enteropelogenes TaxID=29489 RepID=UPI003BA01ED4
MKTSYDEIRHSTMVRDLRGCHFCLTYLNAAKNIKTEICDINNIHSCQAAIHNMISSFAPNGEYRAHLIAELEQACAINILPIEYFDWFKEDERAAFWLWAYICQSDDLSLGIHQPESTINNYQNLYHRLTLSDSLRGHKERSSTIIKFFDSIHLKPFQPKSKYDVLEELKEKWKHIYNSPTPLKWLPDDEASVTWVWDSLRNHFSKESKNNQALHYGLSQMFSPSLTPPLTEWFSPLNHADKLLAVRAALDLWVDAPDSKRLFLLNLNKAWNQRKLRQQRTDKKAVNTYLRNETKAHLDSLAAHYNMRISDVLEMLIKERHQQIKSSS